MKRFLFLLAFLTFYTGLIAQSNVDNRQLSNVNTKNAYDNWTIVIDTTSTGDTVFVTWGSYSLNIVNPFHSSGVSATASDGDVNIVSTSTTADIPYVLSGTSTEGSFTLTTDKKVLLFFDNLSLTSSSELPAIYLTASKKATVTLRGTSTLADNLSNSYKGAVQNKGNFIFQGDGILNVSGYAKHGIQSSEETTITSGTINVLTAVKDGMNVNCFYMTGGSLNVTNPNGDGIDGDEGAIEISGGSITVNCSADDVKGICCDSTLTISGGSIDVTVSGDQSKGIRTKENMYVTGGEITVIASGSVVLEEVGSGYDPSYCSGIKTSGYLSISDGNVTVTCPNTNAGGKGISTDGDYILSGGTVTLTSLGANAAYSDTTGTTDTYKATCLKSDGNIVISGGSLTATASGRALATDNNYTQTGGNVITSTSGNGFTTIGSGTSCTDGFAPACLKADGNISIISGTFKGSSTGTGGRGITCDGVFTMGEIGADDNNTFVYVFTSGSPVNGVSSNNSSIDIWKGLPKGVKIDGNIVINSGYLQSYCAQTSGDPNGEAIESKDSLFINGGYVEANAYDDAINASNYLEINGGHVWAYARGNDAIDCNGTSMYINGGIVIAQGTETGIDDNSDGGGGLYITGGTLVAIGGNMGGVEGTPTMYNQKYITLGSQGGGPGGGGFPGGGTTGTTVSATDGFTIVDNNSNKILTFKAPTVSGSGFLYSFPSNSASMIYLDSPSKEGPGGGGPGGSGSILVSSPDIVDDSYTYFTSPSITGGSNWHGLYSDATVSTSGSGTSVSAQPAGAIITDIDNYLEDSDVLIYPNPTSNILNVVASSISGLQLIDMHGRVIQTWDVTNESMQIDLSSYAKGIYFLRLYNDSQSLMRKIVRK